MLFIDNKYTRWYYNIIERAQTRDTVGYTEKHHIIPKSLGGSNSIENLVILTAREHYICHWLLTKMVTGPANQKMSYALHAMGHLGSSQRYVNSFIYEQNKIECARLRSIARKGVLVGEKNYNYGKKWSSEQRKRMSDYRTGKCFRSNFKYSAESKKKMQDSAKRRWTDEEREKFGLLRLANMFEFTCPHCGKSGRGKNNFLRWHGDNCKSLKTINTQHDKD